MQRRPRRRDEFHLKWLRERPCVLCGATPVDAAHIKMADARVGKPIASNNEKADDRFCLPLCRTHHLEQHSMPERVFWEEHKLDAVLVALVLYSITGDDEAADHLIRTNLYALQELRA